MPSRWPPGSLCFLEPLIPARPPAVTDESIEAFFTRRIGPRMTAEIVEPALAGIYAGDIAELSMPSALPASGRWRPSTAACSKPCARARLRRNRRPAAPPVESPYPARRRASSACGRPRSADGGPRSRHRIGRRHRSSAQRRQGHHPAWRCQQPLSPAPARWPDRC